MFASVIPGFVAKSWQPNQVSLANQPFIVHLSHLVVHLLDEGVVFDTVGFKELEVRHLEGLSDALCDELGL